MEVNCWGSASTVTDRSTIFERNWPTAVALDLEGPSPACQSRFRPSRKLAPIHRRVSRVSWSRSPRRLGPSVRPKAWSWLTPARRTPLGPVDELLLRVFQDVLSKGTQLIQVLVHLRRGLVEVGKEERAQTCLPGSLRSRRPSARSGVGEPPVASLSATSGRPCPQALPGSPADVVSVRQRSAGETRFLGSPSTLRRIGSPRVTTSEAALVVLLVTTQR